MYKSLALCLPLCLAVGSDRVQNLNSVLSHPSQVSKDAMPVDDPIGFLKECLRRFDAENYSGYEMIMLKHERLGGQLQPSEEIEVRYRTKPHSVVLKWLKGQRKANIRCSNDCLGMGGHPKVREAVAAPAAADLPFRSWCPRGRLRLQLLLGRMPQPTIGRQG